MRQLHWSYACKDKYFLIDRNDLISYELLAYRNSENQPNGTSVDRLIVKNKSGQFFSGGSLLLERKEIKFLTCYDVYPASNHWDLVAYGQTTGNVVIATPPWNLNDSWSGKEFAPKHSRYCHCVAWNPLHPGYLAIGLDKFKSDNSLFVWDINASDQTYNNSIQIPLSDNVSDIRRPLSFRVSGSKDSLAPLPNAQSGIVCEFSPSESIHSMAWLPSSPYLLLAGSSHKFVRLYDFREPNAQQVKIQTKATAGICIDPLNDNRFLSAHDSAVALWDLRCVDKPILSLAGPNPVIQLQWHPTRRNVFGALYKDSTFVHMYHVQLVGKADETEISFIDRTLEPKEISSSNCLDIPLNVQSFAFHPSVEGRVIFLLNDCSVSHSVVYQNLALAWHLASHDRCAGLLCAFPGQLNEWKFFNDGSSSQDKNDSTHCFHDISDRMLFRAAKGYGLWKTFELGPGQRSVEDTVFCNTARICQQQGDDILYHTWSWLQRLKSLADKEADSWPYHIKFPGAITIFEDIPNGGKPNSPPEYRPFGSDSHAKYFVSPERDRILQLCGWCMMTDPMDFDNFIDNLVRRNEFERAAAICLFSHRLKMAAQILTNAGSASLASSNDPINRERYKSLQLVALALAGFPNGTASEKDSASSGHLPMGGASFVSMRSSSLWLETCQNILSTIDNPHLKASFEFLSLKCTGGNYFDSILDNKDLPIQDRIAFIGLHVQDSTFVDSLRKIFRQCVAQANLLGLMICGIGNDDCLQLLESYLDHTGDIQTVALIILHTGCLIPIKSYESDGSSAMSSLDTVDPSSHISAISLSDYPVVNANALNMSCTSLVSKKRFDQMVNAYFELLNDWKLWHIRAETETLIAMSNGSDQTSQNEFRYTHPSSRFTPQVYLVCTFCSKYIWSTSGRLRQRYTKPVCCPNCKKPLPRCAVCRVYMGVPVSQTSDKMNDIDGWFSWCQTCRHGGHAKHLLEWFKVHAECPVAGCTCKCSSLDIV